MGSKNEDDGNDDDDDNGNKQIKFQDTRYYEQNIHSDTKTSTM